MQVTTSTMSTFLFWKVFENNFAGCNTCKLKQTINGICASVHFLYQPANFRLCHKKNKGMQQFQNFQNFLSRISEAIDVWKVVRHTPSRHVVACDDYSFKSTIVLFLLQWDIQTIIKLKLKQASKEYQKEFHCKKNTRKASQNVRKKIREKLAKISWWFKASLERFSWMKYCLNLTQN